MVFGVYKCHGVSLYIRIIIFIVVFVIDNLMNTNPNLILLR